MSNFDSAFDYMIKNEGKEFVDDPDDDGGPTKFGITQDAYSHYKLQQVSVDEIRLMTEDDAKQFYFGQYWLPLSLIKIDSDIMATAIFDFAVNIGPSRAARYAQTSCCAAGQYIRIDGHMGPNTIRSLNKCDLKLFIEGFCDLLENHYLERIEKEPKNLKFKAGWLARIARLKELFKESSKQS